MNSVSDLLSIEKYRPTAHGNRWVAIIIGLLIAGSVWAQAPFVNAGVVKSLRGEVKFNGERLSVGQGIPAEGGTINVGASSSMKIGVHRWGSEISFGPDTTAEIVFNGPPNAQFLFLKRGLVQWTTVKTKRVPLGSEMVRTPTAVVQMNGGNFSVRYSSSGESEIAVFSGEVRFESKEEKSGAVLTKGQRAGVGGKYGSKVSSPVKFSADDSVKMQVD